MASIAEQLIGIVGQGAQQTGANLQTGAQLAKGIQDVQMAREKLEQQKQEHEVAKAQKIIDAISNGDKFKDKAAQNLYYKNTIPAMVKAFKMDGIFTPEVLDMARVSPEVRQKLVGLQLDIQDKINSGELRGADILPYAQSRLSAEELPLLDTDALVEQQKFAATEEGRLLRAKLLSDAAAQRSAPGKKGEEELAKNVARKYSEYSAAGGKSGIESSLNALKEAAAALETGKVVTGGLSTRIPGFKSDDVQASLNPKLVEVRTQAQGALNSILRATLGAQFTEKEGERILNQIWDDRLSPAANAKKIRAKIKELESNVKNAEAEFQRFGYLQKSAAAPSAAKTYSVGNAQYSAEQIKQVLQKNPAARGAVDPKILKELGL